MQRKLLCLAVVAAFASSVPGFSPSVAKANPAAATAGLHAQAHSQTQAHAQVQAPSQAQARAQAQAQAMAIYKGSMDQQTLNNPYVRDWMNSAAKLRNVSPQFLQFSHGLLTPSSTGALSHPNAFSPAPRADSDSCAQQQGGDYFNEMIVGGAQRWSPNHFPLRVYIEPNGGNGFRPSFPQICQQAMQQWSCLTNEKFSFVRVNDPAGADVTVSWVPYSSATECGDTTTSWVPDGNGNQWITHANVKLSTWGSGPISDEELHKVCLHELGHALGLKHSSNPSDIMYYRSNAQQVCALGPRDLATISKLYAR